MVRLLPLVAVGLAVRRARGDAAWEPQTHDPATLPLRLVGGTMLAVGAAGTGGLATAASVSAVMTNRKHKALLAKPTATREALLEGLAKTSILNNLGLRKDTNIVNQYRARLKETEPKLRPLTEKETLAFDAYRQRQVAVGAVTHDMIEDDAVALLQEVTAAKEGVAQTAQAVDALALGNITATVVRLMDGKGFGRAVDIASYQDTWASHEAQHELLRQKYEYVKSRTFDHGQQEAADFLRLAKPLFDPDNAETRRYVACPTTGKLAGDRPTLFKAATAANAKLDAVLNRGENAEGGYLRKKLAASVVDDMPSYELRNSIDTLDEADRVLYTFGTLFTAASAQLNPNSVAWLGSIINNVVNVSTPVVDSDFFDELGAGTVANHDVQLLQGPKLEELRQIYKTIWNTPEEAVPYTGNQAENKKISILLRLVCVSTNPEDPLFASFTHDAIGQRLRNTVRGKNMALRALVRENDPLTPREACTSIPHTLATLATTENGQR